MEFVNSLNLATKLMCVRQEIPVLVKKHEGDDYRFSKLDDVYELLTPALNKYRVDFDIVSETPTMIKDGQLAYLLLGNDDYYTYESDLELEWINVDNPVDSRKVTIHAIGTHQVPDKAKGVALTYAIKNYLFHKFSIPQQEAEDPDMIIVKQQSIKDEEQVTGKATNEKHQESKKSQTEKPESKKTELKESSVNRPESKPEVKQPVKSDKQQVSNSTVQPTAAKAPEDKNKSESNQTAKTEKNVANPKQSTVERPEKVTNQNAAKKDDGFTPANEEEVPFEYEDMMLDLETDGQTESAVAGEPNIESAYEEALKCEVNFGPFLGKTLGQMLSMGKKGVAGIKWIAEKFTLDPNLAKAAQTVYQNLQESADEELVA